MGPSLDWGAHREAEHGAEDEGDPGVEHGVPRALHPPARPRAGTRVKGGRGKKSGPAPGLCVRRGVQSSLPSPGPPHLHPTHGERTAAFPRQERWVHATLRLPPAGWAEYGRCREPTASGWGYPGSQDSQPLTEKNYVIAYSSLPFLFSPPKARTVPKASVLTIVGSPLSSPPGGGPGATDFGT